MQVVEAPAERVELLHGDVDARERHFFAARERFHIALDDEPRVGVERIGAAADPQSGSIRFSTTLAQHEQRAIDPSVKTRDPPLQRAAKLLPQDYLVQSQLGYCLLITGQTDAAIGYLKKGASLNSKYGPVWEHLGVAYKKQGRNRDAVSALETATRLMPSSHVAWKHLAEAQRCEFELR